MPPIVSLRRRAPRISQNCPPVAERGVERTPGSGARKWRFPRHQRDNAPWKSAFSRCRLSLEVAQIRSVARACRVFLRAGRYISFGVRWHWRFEVAARWFRADRISTRYTITYREREIPRGRMSFFFFSRWLRRLSSGKTILPAAKRLIFFYRSNPFPGEFALFKKANEREIIW